MTNDNQKREVPVAAKLKLTVLCGEYEIVRALREGVVKPKGIELEFVRFPGTRDIHAHVAQARGADINEYNGGAYVMAKALGRPFTAIPVFLHRRFRHGFIYVNNKSGIEKPSDLIGKRIGSRTYTSAADFWMRGLLEDDYGVPPSAMQWYLQDKSEIPFKPIKGVKMKYIPKGKKIDDMFVRGEIDAFMSPGIPLAIIRGDKRVRRLFPDHKATEKAYFERTGIFPIMHVTTIRDELVEKEPWVVESLTRAFEESKQFLFARIANPRIVPLAWWRADWEEERAALGPDPWEYGMSELNKRNYGMLVDYANRQGLTRRPMKLSDLFPKESFAVTGPFRTRYRSDDHF
jgi:4,5-dihydroxyphthalate decarboxylase